MTTSTQRSQSLRKRRRDAGYKEVRGIWLRPDEHKKLKAYVKACKIFTKG